MGKVSATFLFVYLTFIFYTKAFTKFTLNVFGKMLLLGLTLNGSIFSRSQAK